MRTEVYSLYDRKSRLWQVSLKPLKGGTLHYAEWKTPTVELWWPHQKSLSPVEQEFKVWDVLLDKTSLSTNGLDPVWDFIPSAVPKALASQVLQSTQLSTKEANQIEREAMVLWGGYGIQARQKFHPLLEQVSNGMAFHDKLGIRVFGDLNQMDTRMYQGILHVLNCYAQVMNLDEQKRRLRQRAISEAGVQRYVGPTDPYRGQH